MEPSHHMLTGNECLVDCVVDLSDASVLNFWQWAFSALRANNTRGVFAEWIVAKLLSIPLSEPRDSWAAQDIVTPEGVRIEVKCSAYVQTWSQPRGHSRIVFTGLRGRTWTPETGYSDSQTFNADVYVFCVQTERDASRWNALDLGQWRFWILPKSVLEDLGQKSLSLSKLSKLTKEMTASELQYEATAARCSSGLAAVVRSRPVFQSPEEKAENGRIDRGSDS